MTFASFAVLIAALTGCSGGKGQGHATPTTHAVLPLSTSAATSEAISPIWHRETDSVTKTTFELPGTITSNTQPAAGPQGQKYQIREYTGVINYHLGCSVSVETSLSGTLYLIKLATAPQVFATQFRNEAAKDLVASSAAPVMVDGHPGIVFHITFSPTDGSGSVLWLFEMVDTGTSQVMMQSFGSNSVSGTEQLKLLNTRLTGSLLLP